MKSIRITIRLTPNQLARGLQIVRQLDSTYKFTGINDLVKSIYQDYLAQMTFNRLEEVPSNILDEIIHFIDKPAQQQITLQDLIDIKTSSIK